MHLCPDKGLIICIYTHNVALARKHGALAEHYDAHGFGSTWQTCK